MLQEQQWRMKNEMEPTVEDKIDGGPLSGLLILIRLLFTDQANGSEEDQCSLSHYLLRIFSHISEEHPDFMFQ